MAASLAGRALFIANSSWYLYNFRATLMSRLQSSGWEVCAVCPPGSHSEALADIGFQVLPWEISGRSYGPGNAAMALLALIRILRDTQPGLIHTYTIKPTLLAQIATAVTGDAPPVVSITGLGHAFLGSKLRQTLAELLYRLSIRGGSSLIFQNPDDLQLFADHDLSRGCRTSLILGSGVDVERFSPTAPSEDRPRDRVRVLFVGRLLREKGVCELLEAAEILESRAVPVEVILAGSMELGNPSSLSADVVSACSSVKWLGEVVPVDRLLASADMLVLPSWREGLPRTVIEAMAMGKPAIVTDVPGCRETIEHGVSGLLVPLRSPTALADAIQALASDPQRRLSMGRAGRARAIARFRREIVEQATLGVYARHLGLPDSLA